MIKANITIFKINLAIMSFFSDCLSERFAANSMNNLEYFKTIVIQKIVLMINTLATLVKNNGDEVSARCILRGILDNVTIYCFIYEREDPNEVLFRHYLYTLDGYRTCNNRVIGVHSNNKEESVNLPIQELQNLLLKHPFSKMHNESVNKIISDANWKYFSLLDNHRMSFCEMYNYIGFDNETSLFFQSFLSQFAHGLFLSNSINNTEACKNRVLYESIPLLERMNYSIIKTFSDENIQKQLISSDVILDLLKSEGLALDDFIEYTRAKINRDRILQI